MAGFWNAAKNTIVGSPMFDNDLSVVVDEIENGIHQYTSVAAIYAAIVDRIFGGFNN